MDFNLKKGEVQTIYSDFMNKLAKENMIQLTDTEAIRFELNKDKNCVNMVYINTLFDEPEKKSEISKEDFAKFIKGAKDMFVQLT